MSSVNPRDNQSRRRRCHLQFLGFSNRQRRSDRVDFQYRRPAADIRQKLARWIFLTIKFNREIVCFTPDRVRSVKGPCRIDEKSSARNFAVLIDTVNLNHCVGRAPKDVFNLLAKRNRGLLLSIKERNRGKGKTQREAESADGREPSPGGKPWCATKI